MRVLHGGAHLAEQTQPLARCRGVAGRSTSVIGDALDVLHDEVRQASVGDHAAVEQPRDVGVVQRREDLPLGDESAAMQIVGVRAAAQEP